MIQQGKREGGEGELKLPFPLWVCPAIAPQGVPQPGSFPHLWCSGGSVCGGGVLLMFHWLNHWLLLIDLNLNTRGGGIESSNHWVVFSCLIPKLSKVPHWVISLPNKRQHIPRLEWGLGQELRQIKYLPFHYTAVRVREEAGTRNRESQSWSRDLVELFNAC